MKIPPSPLYQRGVRGDFHASLCPKSRACGLVWYEIYNRILPAEQANTESGWVAMLRNVFSSQYSDKTLSQHLRQEIHVVVDAYLNRNFKKLEILFQNSSDFRLKSIGEMILTRSIRLLCTSEQYSELWATCFSSKWTSYNYLYEHDESINCYRPAHEQDIRRRLAEEAANLTPEWSSACGVHDCTADRRDTGDRAQD